MTACTSPHGAQPRIEREVAVRGHQVGVVVGRLRVDVVAARRLQADDHVAALERGQGELVGGGEVERVVPGLAPAFVDAAAHRRRQRVEEPAVRAQAQGDRYLAAVPRGVGRPAAEPPDQCVAVAREVRDAMARAFEGAQQLDHAGGGVQSDPVADPAVAVRVVGEDDREAAPFDRRAAQPQPARGELRDELDPVGHRLVDDQRALRGLVETGLALEGDCAGEDPPVDLGQCHVHGDVPGGESPGAGAPVLLVAAGEHHLEHGRSRGVQRRVDRRPTRRGDGEARCRSALRPPRSRPAATRRRRPRPGPSGSCSTAAGSRSRGVRARRSARGRERGCRPAPGRDRRPAPPPAGPSSGRFAGRPSRGCPGPGR